MTTLKYTRNFLYKCVRCSAKYENTEMHLDAFPQQPCPMALRRILALPHGEKFLDGKHSTDTVADVEQCPWYIIDEDANFCFFKWSTNPQNQQAFTLESISLLFGTSCINVWISERRALASATKAATQLKLKN